MSSLITIKGRVRSSDEKGKNVCYRLRKNGELPGNLVSGTQSTPITLDPKFLSVAWKNGRTFNFDLNGKVQQVSITELQIDPVKRSPVHVDLKPM
jgi:ribosomal protein L25 (general stress protein Ctc)